MSFVDTDVPVYAAADSAPFHDRARAALIRLAVSERLSISRQILHDHLAVMTRQQTWGKPLTLMEAIADAAAFTNRFDVLEDGRAVWDQLCELSRNCAIAGRQVHDANIAATMLADGERRLLTFNTGDFQRFGALIELAAA